MNIMNRTLRGVKNSPWAVILMVIAVWGLWIAVNLTIEDYNTSLMAYQQIPTRKVDESVVEQAAWLPQLMPILFGFMYMRDTNRRGFGWASLIIMVLDMLTDTWYKTSGLDLRWTLVGLAETFFLYTIGSEVLLSVTISIIMYLFRPGITQLIAILNGSTEFVGDIVGEFTEGRTTRDGRGGTTTHTTPDVESFRYQPGKSPYPTAREYYQKYGGKGKS